jgi:hypothetical protein
LAAGAGDRRRNRALEVTEAMTRTSADAFLALDIAGHRREVNVLLQRTSELVRTDAARPKPDHRGADLMGAVLINADLRGANLSGAHLISADLRGADLTAAVGEPRRLARQLFALTEGFLGPLFFVWVGASLDLRQLGHHPKFVLLGLALAAGTLVSHMAMRATGQPLAVGTLAAVQLGVPVAAVTVGSQLHVLKSGEPAALILAALLSIGIASVAARHA